MADPTDTPASQPGYVDSESAPFIYFDTTAAFGVLSGAVQVELIARTIAPDGPGTVTRFVVTGRLRCSPAAAANLKDALEKALAMLDQPQEPTGSAIN